MKLMALLGEWRVATSGKPDALGATSRHILHRVAEFIKTSPESTLDSIDTTEERFNVDEVDEEEEEAVGEAPSANPAGGIAGPIRVPLPREVRATFKDVRFYFICQTTLSLDAPFRRNFGEFGTH